MRLASDRFIVNLLRTVIIKNFLQLNKTILKTNDSILTIWKNFCYLRYLQTIPSTSMLTCRVPVTLEDHRIWARSVNGGAQSFKATKDCT